MTGVQTCALPILISNLNLPWRNLRPFPLVLSLVTWKKRPTPMKAYMPLCSILVLAAIHHHYILLCSVPFSGSPISWSLTDVWKCCPGLLSSRQQETGGWQNSPGAMVASLPGNQIAPELGLGPQHATICASEQLAHLRHGLDLWSLSWFSCEHVLCQGALRKVIESQTLPDSLRSR